ncbi:MAG TPA: NAD-binding protein, partial [Fimbriimonadaceae bacterium]|nr:NAD-binding protein [Fimbriimonadaceae bacterium]
VLTIAFCPLLVAAAPTFGRALAKRIVPARKLAREESEAREATRGLSDHILVTGFGEAGRAAVDGLRDFGYHVVVLETDRRLVGAVREAGCQALLGDASQADILEDAGLLHAKALVVALSDHRSARLVTSQARRLAPHVPIVARARYHLFLDEIDAAGADRTVDEETLVGRKLADELHVLFGTVWDHEGRDRLT